MDAQGAPPLGDVDQPAHEVRELTGQGGELVDDDGQPGDGGERGPPHPELEVVGQVLGAGRGQQLLPAPELGTERLERPLDQVRVEIGDHAHRVRQVDAVLERGAALVVDEHEVHLVGPVGHGQGRDEGLQQLALARPGGPGDQGVRTIDAEIDRERAVEGFADHRDGAARRQQPSRLDGVGSRRIQVQHLEQAARVRDRTVLELRAGVPDRRDTACHPVEPVVAYQVGTDGAQHVDPLLADGQPRRLGDDHRRALLGEQPLVGVDADAVDPDGGTLREQPHQSGHAAQPSGPIDDGAPPAVRCASSRASSWATSSAMRRAVLVAVTPRVVIVSCPAAGRTWGSHAIQLQVS
jgi:hypothetical protein